MTGLDFWSPNVNIFRDPRWGRGQESYGEDPYLSGRFAIAFVKGIQGDDPVYFKAIATPKHYAVHSGPEPLRHQFDAVITDEDLYTTYLPQFEAAIREGHAHSVMSAYNALDGVPDSCNKRLLTDILRTQWGFDGYVVSDDGSVADILNSHRYAQNAVADLGPGGKGRQRPRQWHDLRWRRWRRTQSRVGQPGPGGSSEADYREGN